MAEARRILQKAIATDPKLALARQGLGVAALIEGQPDAALPELETARQLDPQDASTNLYLGLALKELDRPMDAAIEFIQVLSLSQDPQVLDLARENLQQVYNKLIPGGTSQRRNVARRAASERRYACNRSIILICSNDRLFGQVNVL